MTFRKDWCKAFVKSPLVGNYNVAAKVKTLQQKVEQYTGASECDISYDKMLGVIKIRPKYPVVCPHCGAPHNPNEMRCEYCGGYMKEE